MIPIHDSPRRRIVPWVNYALMAVNILVFLYMASLSTTAPPPRSAEYARQMNALAGGSCYELNAAPTDINRFVCKYAFQPREFFDNLRGVSAVSRPDRPIILVSLLTSLFLHASWAHLLGNMLFLWVFGDNVEDRLGHGRYLLFYLLAGMVASLVQGAIDPTSVAVVVGASGAIAGVLGAYLGWFARERVYGVIPLPILVFIPIPVPAWLMLGSWFLLNLAYGFGALTQTAGPDSGVAFFAHVGGFVFGLTVALLAFRRRASTQ